MKEGQSITALDGKLRIRYSPSWNPSYPFDAYEDGSLRSTFATLEGAKRFLSEKRLRWTRWSSTYKRTP